MLMAREILSFLHSTIQILSGMEDKESIPSMGVTIPFNRGQCLDETVYQPPLQRSQELLIFHIFIFSLFPRTPLFIQ